MDPKLFLDTARILQKDKQEASIRSVVSRSYYAMIIHIKNELERLLGRNHFDKQVNIHHYIPVYLRNSQVKEAEMLSNIISDFRDRRNESDYDMKLRFTEADKMYITISENIIADFDKIDSKKLQDGIKNYVKTVRREE